MDKIWSFLAWSLVPAIVWGGFSTILAQTPRQMAVGMKLYKLDPTPPPPPLSLTTKYHIFKLLSMEGIGNMRLAESFTCVEHPVSQVEKEEAYIYYWVTA